MVGTEELYIPVDPAGMDPWDPERGEMVARGTCLGASLVCIAVCDVADDSPISDETGLAAYIHRPVLANIFDGYCEKRAFADPHSGVQPPSVYYWYVDDIFAVFASTSTCKVFLAYLNSLNTSLEFTLQMERPDVLPFLDVLVEKSADAYKTTVYCKSTFTGQYTWSDSYSSSG